MGSGFQFSLQCVQLTLFEKQMMPKKCICQLFLLTILYEGLHVIPTALGCEPCQFSVFTETEVDSCPETQDELFRRKAEKKCETWATLQNCTEPERFKYHCAMNEHENKFIEVCAKEHRINGGHCTEYNKLGRTIQEHHILKCSTLKPKCPPTYLSSEAYLCKDCYDIVRLQQNGSCSIGPQDISNAMNNPNNTNEIMNSNCNDSSGCDFKVCVTVKVVAGVEFVIIIFMIIRARTQRLRRQRRKQNQEKIIENGDDDSNLSMAENSP